MGRRLATLWLLTLALLGNLLSPALALRCASFETVRACCCCGPSASLEQEPETLRERCGCELAPASLPDRAPTPLPFPVELPALLCPPPVGLCTPEETWLSPARIVEHTSVVLQRPHTPQSGRAPPAR